MPADFVYNDSPDLSRIHLYGFKFSAIHESPFNVRFNVGWPLQPYMDVFSDDVKKLLYRRSMLLRLVPIFAKHTRLAGLLNSLVGTDIIKDDDKKKGMIEEFANALLDDDESRKTLYSRIDDVEGKLAQNRQAVQGISTKRGDRPSLKGTALQSGTVIAVEGVLNRASSLIFDPIRSRALTEAGVQWLISDDPFFLMGQHNPVYDGGFIALRFPPGLLEAAQVTPPFRAGFDWYPYVSVVGVYQENWNATAPGIKTLDVRWVRLRRPRDYNDHFEENLRDAYTEESWRRHQDGDPPGHRKPFLLETDELDSLFTLYLMMFTYGLAGGTIQEFSKECAERAKNLKQSLKSIPPDLARYYQW